MKTVCEFNKCTGCMACTDICEEKAIIIKQTLSAYNAEIDENKCIKCHACYRVCQNNIPLKLKEPLFWKQGWANDHKVRAYSSSGGLASAIELSFVKSGGYVCSCTFIKGDFVFQITNKIKEIIKFSGSKYVKSNPHGCYREIKHLLVNGEKVLFVGLPCQVAAVKRFTGEKLSERLFAIDLICHGTPSSQILNIFLEQYEVELSEIDEIQFRHKVNYDANEKQYLLGEYGVLDKYSMSFLYSICFTDNCYECRYAKKERVSDITLGDSWGSDLPDEEHRKGISLILCQTIKGVALLKNADIHLEDVDVNKALKCNRQLQHPSIKPRNRDYFFRKITMEKKFNHVVRRCCPKISFKQFIKAYFIKANLLNNKAIYNIYISERIEREN